MVTADHLSILDSRTRPRAYGVMALFTAIATWVRQRICGVAGHVMLLSFAPDRLSLKCGICGAETRGWAIDVNPALRHVSTPPRARPAPPKPLRLVTAAGEGVHHASR